MTSLRVTGQIHDICVILLQISDENDVVFKNTS